MFSCQHGKYLARMFARGAYMNKKSILIGIILLLVLSIYSFAEVPKTINFQGRLMSNGVAATGSGSILFKIYTSPTSVTAIWSETDTVNFDTNGVFSVQLGSVTPLNMNFDQPLWVEMTYPSTSTTPLSPKQSLNTSPYSFYAVTAETAVNVVNGGVPIGTVLASASTIEPAGYIICSGKSLAVLSYPALFAAISYTYGGSGANFNVPDYRGYFLRGWDNGRGVDPDSSSRTIANGTGTTVGNVLGSIQGDQFKSHNHGISPNFLASSSGYFHQAASGTGAWPDKQDFQTYGTQSNGGNETRPVNMYVMYIIRAY
jgi:microcystin-dependent protein